MSLRMERADPHTTQLQPDATTARLGYILVGVLLTAMIVVLSGYALTTTAVMSRTVHFSIGLAGVLFVWLVITGKPLASRNTWLPTVVAAVLFVMALLSSLVYANASLASALHIPAMILCGYLLAQTVPFDVFIRWFSTAMAILALIALSAWLLFIVLGFPMVGSTVTNFNGAVYHNGGAYFLLMGWDGIPIDRSMGPFWEPGLFASFLVMALIFEISYRKQATRTWVIISLVLGVYIAQSTAGFLLVIPALALFVFKRRSAISRVIAFIFSLLIMVAFSQLETIISRLAGLDPEVFGKLQDDAIQSSSRFNIFDLNIRIFGDSPLLGWSFEGADQEVLSRMTSAGVAAQTSTSTYFLAALGIVGVVYTLGWFSILRHRRLSVSERIIILTCFLIIINKEPHTAILVTYTLLFYYLAMAQKDQKTLESTGQVATL